MIENNISLPKVFIDITQYLHPPFLLAKDAYSVVKPWNHDGETLISHNSWRSRVYNTCKKGVQKSLPN